MLTSFIDEWNRTRPDGSGTYASGHERRGSEFVRPIEYLASATGWPGDGVSPSSIQNIYGGRRTYVELRHADALVAALDEPQAWYDGRLEVRPNPQAAEEARAGCCSGSLNGAAVPPAT